MGLDTISKRAVIYARVSYDNRGSEARNLQAQLREGREYCERMGYRVVAELAEDVRGASGADESLPMLAQALEIAHFSQFDAFCVRNVARFSRDLGKWANVKRVLEGAGVRIGYWQFQLPEGPAGKLLEGQMAVFSDWERGEIVRRLAEGRRNAVRSGRVILHGDRPPFGFRLRGGQLEIYEPEAVIVRWIYTWYVVGDEEVERLICRAITRRLTEEGVPTWRDIHKTGFQKTRRGFGEWSRSSVHKILTNELYVGVWRYEKNSANPLVGGAGHC